MEEISDEILERIAGRLKAMGNPFRLRILQSLLAGELSVTEILARVGGSQANVSKHLNVLRGADLVISRREGVSVLYQISDESVYSICETVCDSLLHQASSEVATIAAAGCVIDLEPTVATDDDPTLSAEMTPLGLIPPHEYVAHARQALVSRVTEPFGARGIECATPEGWQV